MTVKTGQGHLVAVVGPESTGKTTLARELAAAFDAPFLPEYARKYLEERLERTGDASYDETDLTAIAHEHIRREAAFAQSSGRGGVIDTDLIVILIWWSERFGQPPAWLHDAIAGQPKRLYLLCAADLPWQADPLRESEHDRGRLFDVYQTVLTDLRLPFAIVAGQGSARLDAARSAASPILGAESKH